MHAVKCPLTHIYNFTLWTTRRSSPTPKLTDVSLASISISVSICSFSVNISLSHGVLLPITHTIYVYPYICIYRLISFSQSLRLTPSARHRCMLQPTPLSLKDKNTCSIVGPSSLHSHMHAYCHTDPSLPCRWSYDLCLLSFISIMRARTHTSHVYMYTSHTCTFKVSMSPYVVNYPQS